MTKNPFTPWHRVVAIREDLLNGELSLASFAADLYEVAMGRGRTVYKDAGEFFALTYPTFNLRELAKDVVLRLARKNDKAIRQLELMYGGGKTHTLITLYHLVNDPQNLPDLPAVNEFKQHIGLTPPKARTALLAFDKLDVEKGMEVKAPSGETRWLRHPWSVLAFQLAGPAGLRILHADGKDAERESAPAENLLLEVLAAPGKEGFSTLILMDEVLMYAREKVRHDPGSTDSLANFFQYLTQAVTKVDRCAMVVSLLATDPRKMDPVGKQIVKELEDRLRREKEENIQPVTKDDVAEVLRRRFFKPESIRDREAFRPHVVAALKGIADLDEAIKKDGKAAEDRFLHSYPFHPDLTEVFYTKWTNLDGFQRTRGILRTFALALRESEKWDQAPLVATNVFLTPPGKGGLSESARELAGVATYEEVEGKHQAWTGILEGELTKAQEIQQELAGLHFREVEQAVMATFLHSQPVGQKASTRDMKVLLGHTRPDKIDLEKGLSAWARGSWFLDETMIARTDADGKRSLPEYWRLGSKPNLTQMHFDACRRVLVDLIDARLVDEIKRLKSLTEGAAGVGAAVHNLPAKPSLVDDDGEFHYVVLGPKASSDSGKPSAEARRYLEEKTTADHPRVFRNSVVVAAPSKEGLDVARERIKEYLAWELVQDELKKQQALDPLREETLRQKIGLSLKSIPNAVHQAYSVVVTIGEKNEVHAFKLTASDEPLFRRIKADPRSRIRETAITAEALLPEAPYNLWREGETSRRVKDLVGAFAQFPHLPKMLNRGAIVETLLAGVREGQFALRLPRADGSARVVWRQDLAEGDLKDPGVELVLPEAATLTELPPSLLAPGALTGLWKGDALPFSELTRYFGGGHVVKVKRENYEEPLCIPKVEPAALEQSVAQAVKSSRVWVIAGTATLLGEDVPAGLLSSDAVLHQPPAPIPTAHLLANALPGAWSNGEASAASITKALSQAAGKPLPWKVVRDAIDGALRSRVLDRTATSGVWPCDYAAAASVRLRTPVVVSSTGTTDGSPKAEALPSRGLFAEAELRGDQIQDLADQLADISKVAKGVDLRFTLRIAFGGDKPPPDAVVVKIEELLIGITPELKFRR